MFGVSNKKIHIKQTQKTQLYSGHLRERERERERDASIQTMIATVNNVFLLYGEVMKYE